MKPLTAGRTITTMDTSAIRVGRHGPAMIITLDRPDRLNAYTDAMGRAIARAIAEADADDAVRAVILTGAGRAFCAGADVSAGAGAFDTTAGEGARNFGSGEPRGQADSFVHALWNSRKVTIAAINGPAVGVGITMTLPCDIRLMADTARAGFVFARRGLVPEAGSAWFLPRLVGMATALRWCLTGQMVGAEEARAAGLVSEVTTVEALLPRTLAIAEEIAASTAPVAVAMTRAMLWRLGSETSPDAALAVDARYNVALGAGGDVREGVSAFLEKRAPHFPGRVGVDEPPGYPWWTVPMPRGSRSGD